MGYRMAAKCSTSGFKNGFEHDFYSPVGVSSGYSLWFQVDNAVTSFPSLFPTSNPLLVFYLPTKSTVSPQIFISESGLGATQNKTINIG